MNYGDTIYAVRKGKVYSISMPRDIKNENDSFYAKVSNVEIYQNDCSSAMYKGIHNVLVEKNQEVEAGEPIALAGLLTNKSKATLSFTICYFEDIGRKKIDSGGVPYSFYYTYINPKFYTKEGGVNFLEEDKTYTSVHPEEIITKEMTKKELKRWKKKHL